MKQHRAISAIEAVLNIGSGFVISVLVWQVLAGYYGYPMPLSRNLEITTIFTVVSVLRSYVWRRAFVAHLDKFLHRRLGVGYDK